MIEEKKYFTIREAEKMIPELSKKILQLNRFKERMYILMNSKKVMDNVIEVTNEEGFEFLITKEVKINREFHKIAYKFYKMLDELNGTGVIVKDTDFGIVDFYHKLSGRTVFLCWHLGERRIAHWHEIDDDYEERKKIIFLLPAKKRKNLA